MIFGKQRKVIDHTAPRKFQKRSAFGMGEDVRIPYGKIGMNIPKELRVPFGCPVGVTRCIDRFPFRFDQKHAVKDIRELRTAVRNGIKSNMERINP